MSGRPEAVWKAPAPAPPVPNSSTAISYKSSVFYLMAVLLFVSSSVFLSLEALRKVRL